MFRLVRGIVGLGIVGVLVYGAVAVPLGEKTLWEHIKAIAGSKEGKKLVDGVKHKADEVLKSGPAQKKNESPSSRPSDDKLTPRERRELKKLIRERLEKKASERGKKKGPGQAEAPAQK